MINYILESLSIIIVSLIFLLVLVFEFLIQYKILLYLVKDMKDDNTDYITLLHYLFSTIISFCILLVLNEEYKASLVNQLFMIFAIEEGFGIFMIFCKAIMNFIFKDPTFKDYDTKTSSKIIFILSNSITIITIILFTIEKIFL